METEKCKYCKGTGNAPIGVCWRCLGTGGGDKLDLPKKKKKRR